MAIIQVEIISDTICPWCYIGYRILQQAIALYQKTYPGGSEDQFQIAWKPYFIDQIPPVESVLIQDRMLRRMSMQQVQAAQTRLKRVGASVGINFKFGGSIGSSRLAHRLLLLAERDQSGLECTIAETIFHYQFELERDLSELESVVEVGVKCGLSESETRKFLMGDDGIVDVESNARKTREAGIQGVPHFSIGGQHYFDGAGDMYEFFQAFVAAREALTPHDTAPA